MNYNLNEFQTLTNRLHIIEFFPEHLKNIEVWNCFSVFENCVFGIVSQYHRIHDNFGKNGERLSITQAQLDIYYYTLTWDKLKKSFDKLQEWVNKIQQYSSDLPGEFTSDYRLIRKRIAHLFSNYQVTVRNEYEHPSWQPNETGNIRVWRTLMTDGHGNISAHVGKEEYAIVRKTHVDLLNNLWVELVDIFVKYFSDKTLSSDLLLLKDQIENNIDKSLNEYNQFKSEGEDDLANQILHQLLLLDIHFARENMSLSQDTKEKIYGLMEKQEPKN